MSSHSESSSNKQLVDARRVFHDAHGICLTSRTVDFVFPCELPFRGAERVKSAKPCSVEFAKYGDDLYLNGQKLRLFLSERQKEDKVIVSGYDILKELEARGNNLSAKILDYLKRNKELWPESWKKDKHGKTIFVNFWGDIFRRIADDRLCVRYGYWLEGKVVSRYRWLNRDWNHDRPAASLV